MEDSDDATGITVFLSPKTNTSMSMLVLVSKRNNRPTFRVPHYIFTTVTALWLHCNRVHRSEKNNSNALWNITADKLHKQAFKF